MKSSKSNTKIPVATNFFEAFLVFLATWDAEPAGILLKLRRNLGIVGREVYRRGSKRASKEKRRN